MARILQALRPTAGRGKTGLFWAALLALPFTIAACAGGKSGFGRTDMGAESKGAPSKETHEQDGHGDGHGAKNPLGKKGPGYHAYVKGKRRQSSPPDRAGGPLTVSASQSNGATRFILPGTRTLDPHIFGTPELPSGFEPAPFPMCGIQVGLRLTHDGEYSIVDHFSPFSDWYEEGTGSVTMKVTDVTAIDGKSTKDRIEFEATFELPDGAEYRVVVKDPLPHGGAFPFFGGVVTNHVIHGAAGIAPRLLPTVFAYAAFWGKGDVYKNGSLINKGQLVHVWLSEHIRGDGDRLRTDEDSGNASKGLTVHMIVPPYKPTPEGMKKTPLRTMFMPFPYVKKNIQREMKMAKQAGDQDRIAVVKQIQTVAKHTKEHVVNATARGKMFGMPFIHMKFDDVEMSAGD